MVVGEVSPCLQECFKVHSGRKPRGDPAVVIYCHGGPRCFYTVARHQNFIARAKYFI